MKNTEFKVRGAGDSRLAVHATSAFPTWLWSIDGTRLLWTNPVGARVFGAFSAARLGDKVFGPADPHRRQVTQLAHRLKPSGTIRLERLRGFGAALGSLMTCGCTRLDLAGGHEGILIVATAPIGRTMPLVERLQHLVEDADEPVAALTHDGLLVAASRTAAPLFDLHRLSGGEFEQARLLALKDGRAEAALDTGRVTLHRVGQQADTSLLAFITPAAAGEGSVAVKENGSPDSGNGASQAASRDALLNLDGSMPPPRRRPLRFMWQMDAEGRFALGSDAFTRLIGVHTAAGFGRPWRKIERAFGLDPEGLVLKAIATRETWSGITLNWPVDGGGHLRIELSGLPIHDAAKNFIGYRGFGVCRDLEGLARLEALRSQEFFNDPPSADMMSSEIGLGAAAPWPATEPVPDPLVSHDGMTKADAATPIPVETAQQADMETPMETHEDTPNQASPNVVPFRPLSETRAPVLSPVENNAFNELARQLSARLEGENIESATADPSGTSPTAIEPSATVVASEASTEPPNWLAPSESPPRVQAPRDTMLLDLLPTGVLIYRLDRLLYANRAFLDRVGYPSLHALEQEGGLLDALNLAPGVSSASSTSVTISLPHAPGEATPTSGIDARLHAIDWDEDTALALIFSSAAAESPPPAAATAPPAVVPQPSATGHANAEELAAILDTTADGILMFDAEGSIHSCNRSAEALFGYDGAELVHRNFAALFAPESQNIVNRYFDSLKGTGVASLLEHGREVLGRERGGGLIPLSMTMGRTQAQGSNFFAVFRDLSQSKRSESELHEARRLADRTSRAKADMLARISHEIRTPLNAIIGFAEVMIGERFGALGNERYVEYMKDVRAAGERVIAVVDDLTDLSRIETGKLDLAFTDQNLNDIVESCVAVMQPQANRERIIIRTSLAPMLPPVVTDALALRQITMNLIGNSIHLAHAGGQVIVSTALTDFGEIALRIRDTGRGLNDNEVAAAMEPFRDAGLPDQAPEAGVTLSLTKALVEAIRAQFNIKTAAHSGTLVEVIFSRTLARAKR